MIKKCGLQTQKSLKLLEILTIGSYKWQEALNETVLDIDDYGKVMLGDVLVTLVEEIERLKNESKSL